MRRSPADFPTFAALDESGHILRAVHAITLAVGRDERVGRRAQAEAVHVRELADVCRRVASTFPASWSAPTVPAAVFPGGIDVTTAAGRDDFTMGILVLVETGSNAVRGCEPAAAARAYGELARVLGQVEAAERAGFVSG